MNSQFGRLLKEPIESGRAGQDLGESDAEERLWNLAHLDQAGYAGPPALHGLEDRGALPAETVENADFPAWREV